MDDSKDVIENKEVLMNVLLVDSTKKRNVFLFGAGVFPLNFYDTQLLKIVHKTLVVLNLFKALLVWLIVLEVDAILTFLLLGIKLYWKTALY